MQRAVCMKSVHGRGEKLFPGTEDTMEEEVNVRTRTNGNSEKQRCRLCI